MKDLIEFLMILTIYQERVLLLINLSPSKTSTVEIGSGPRRGLKQPPAATLSEVEPVRGNKVSRPR